MLLHFWQSAEEGRRDKNTQSVGDELENEILEDRGCNNSSLLVGFCCECFEFLDWYRKLHCNQHGHEHAYCWPEYCLRLAGELYRNRTFRWNMRRNHARRERLERADHHSRVLHFHRFHK